MLLPVQSICHGRKLRVRDPLSLAVVSVLAHGSARHARAATPTTPKHCCSAIESNATAKCHHSGTDVCITQSFCCLGDLPVSLRLKERHWPCHSHGYSVLGYMVFPRVSSKITLFQTWDDRDGLRLFYRDSFKYCSKELIIGPMSKESRQAGSVSHSVSGSRLVSRN